MTDAKITEPDLYFADYRPDGRIDYWPPASPPFADEQNEGMRRADALISLMRRKDSPITLPFVVEAVARSGQFGGVERAFLHRIGEHLL